MQISAYKLRHMHLNAAILYLNADICIKFSDADIYIRDRKLLSFKWEIYVF